MMITVNYLLRFTKSAEKSIIKIEQSLPAIGRKIQTVIESLSEYPHLGLKLQGLKQETRRIRVGDYRIIYEVYAEQFLIIITYIGPRGGAYK